MNPIQYQATEFWQTLFDQDTGAIYQKALHKTWQLLKQLLRFFLLLLLFVTVVVVWVWSVGFQSGSGFRLWLQQNPDPGTIALKAIEILLFPFKIASIWLEKQAKELFGWDLKLTELLPAEPARQIPAAIDQTIEPNTAAKTADLKLK
jgi:hypothetical protein